MKIDTQTLKEIITQIDDDNKSSTLKKTLEECFNKKLQESDIVPTLQKIFNTNNNEVQKIFSELYNANSIDVKKISKYIDKLLTGKNDLLLNTTSQWMTNLPPDIKAMPLKDLVLPGTHDTGAQQILWSSMPSTLNTLTKKILFKIVQYLPFIQNIISKWTLTQKKGIRAQLNDGIRVLDLRLAKDTKNELYLGHTFLVEKLEDSLTAIKGFIENNPQEIIMINIKVDSGYKFTQKDHQKATEMICSTLGNNSVSKELDTNNSIADIMGKQKQKQNLFLYYKNAEALRPDIFRDNNQEIWPNTTKKLEVISKIQSDQYYQDAKEKKFVYASLNTTPDIKSILKATIKNQDLLTKGKVIQKDPLDTLLQNVKDHEQNHGRLPISGIILDNYKSKSVKKIINHNVERLQSKRKQESLKTTRGL